MNRWLPPSCNTHSGEFEPRPLIVNGIIIHYISAINVSDDPWDIDAIVNKILIPYKVSYHTIIERDGSEINFIPELHQAFHAGKSRLNGVDYCNTFCLGLSLLSTGEPKTHYDGLYPDTQTPAFEPTQLMAAARWCKKRLNTYGIRESQIAGHDKVREQWNLAHPDRKARPKPDPGKHFPWVNFRTLMEVAI